MSRRFRLLVLAIAGWCRPALADDHAPVQLTIDPCVNAPAEEIRRIVSIELGGHISDTREPTADVTRASATCDGSAVTLRVDDAITGKSLSRTIDLGATPRARPRLVALAIAELVSASWTELTVDPQPDVSPNAPASSEERRGAVAVQTARVPWSGPPLRVSLFGSGLKFFSRTALLAGGGLGLALDRSELIGWRIDAQAHHGSESTPLGHVDTDVLSVGVAALIRRAWSRSVVHLGVGARGGAVRMSGAPSMTGVEGSRFWAPWVGAFVLGSAELRLAHRTSLDAQVTTGYVVRPVGGLVSDRREVAVDGAWVEVHIGVARSL
jgi:hypothetical protein